MMHRSFCYPVTVRRMKNSLTELSKACSTVQLCVIFFIQRSALAQVTWLYIQETPPLAPKATKHVIDLSFNSPKYIFGSPVLRENQLYQVSSAVTFCNSISIMPFLIHEKTCKQQAYRKAYWPGPSVVYFPVRVYSGTLSGSHCHRRITSKKIVSVPEWLSVCGHVFAKL